MEKFFERRKLLKLIQEEKYNLNSFISIKEIEFVDKNLLLEKIPGQNGLTGEFHQIFKKETKSILQKYFQNTKEERIFSNHSMRPVLLRYQNQKILKESYRIIHLMKIAADFLNQI